ncbi:hypothetical protein AMTR_s00108p00145500 [Amborella trichopoda]|uniref:Uncharacterized protein n=1 Tax=Amborella trichopoda TaxID=13333 RepID=W1NVS1_AMBTC|nr:hypothetical protein AMTR_s00108p00145500 [Amborella trichopoda]
MKTKCKVEDNLAKGKLRLAVEDFKGALALDPNHTAYHVHLAYQKALGLASEHFRPSLLSSCAF